MKNKCTYTIFIPNFFSSSWPRIRRLVITTSSQQPSPGAKSGECEMENSNLLALSERRRG
jgi:hypothetical protein